MADRVNLIYHYVQIVFTLMPHIITLCEINLVFAPGQAIIQKLSGTIGLRRSKKIAVYLFLPLSQ